jgi:mRNA interferase RelE/StbE
MVPRIEGLASEPRPHGCEKLSGLEQYRVRQGDYRVVYGVDDEARVVIVVKIGHRRDVYR